MAELLVSVRMTAEAAAALEGGAGLIDIKDPSRGSLGRASDENIQSVIDCVSRRRPVSAALGEWHENPDLPKVNGLAYVKWGLSGCRFGTSWRAGLSKTIRQLKDQGGQTQVVLVAYADSLRAAAPAPEEILAFARQVQARVMLIDTWRKDDTTLLDWLSFESLANLRQRARQAGIALALAGRLGVREILKLRSLEPEWFAVRSAVCVQGRREAVIDPSAVLNLTNLLLDGVINHPNGCTGYSQEFV